MSGRRLNPRYAVQKVVVIAQFALRHELFRVPCRDIGLGGVFLKTRERVPPGEEVNLAVRLPVPEGMRTLELHGTVVRADHDGVAVAFCYRKEDEGVRAELEAYLDGLEPPTERVPAPVFEDDLKGR